jgi:hypothetical protein
MGAELIHADKYDEANRPLSRVCERAKNWILDNTVWGCGVGPNGP